MNFFGVFLGVFIIIFKTEILLNTHQDSFQFNYPLVIFSDQFVLGVVNNLLQTYMLKMLDLFSGS